MTINKGKDGKKRKVGCVIWILGGLLALGLLIAGIVVWAQRNGSASTLDRLDSALSGSDARLSKIAVSYGDHPAMRIDVMEPANRDPAKKLPVILFFHGGGWYSGAPEDYRFVGRTLAPKGYIVVLAGYRLKEDGRFPVMLEDSAKAVRWTVENVAELGGDPQRIILAGHSAGAYNSVMLALDRQWLGREGLSDNAIKGVVGLAGPYDFYPFTADSARNALGKWHRPQDTQPIHWARGDAVPLLLLHGSDDTVVKPRNSKRLAQAIDDLGGKVEGRVVAGWDHYDIVMKLARPFSRDTRVIDAIDDFAQRHAAASPPVQKLSAMDN